MNLLRRAQPRSREHGQTLVEFALILPIFILVLMGIFDLSRAVYANNTIANAAREANRLAIVDQNISAIEGEAVAHAVNLGITASDVDVVFRRPGLPDVCISPVALACEVEVIVRYQYTAATPIIGNIVGIIDMEATARQPVERSYESP